MGINHPFRHWQELPETLPLFPIERALLLPRGELPVNVFEARYLAMVDMAMASNRIIGMIQPRGNEHDARPVEGATTSDLRQSDLRHSDLRHVGCAGRITQMAETGDGRYLITLSGIARFRLVDEVETSTPWRQGRVDFSAFADDLVPRKGEDAVNRLSVIDVLKRFAEANNITMDWDSVHQAPNEALVNALAMMSPFGPDEKQALLEAVDLRERAEVLIAVTEMALARDGRTSALLQ
jgi:Lon protease-like protein